MNRRRFLAASAGLALTGCGGGGSSAAPEFIGVPPTAYRPGVMYGYWGDDAETAADVAGHSDLYVAAHWNGWSAGAIANIARAKAAGFKKLLILLDAVRPTVEATVDTINAYMADLTLAGSFDGMDLVGLIWCDEPNGLDEAYVRGVNTALRSLTTLPLWVCYADEPGRPGLDAKDDPRGAFDRVAVDQYDIGCQVLGALDKDLANRMKPGAKRWLVPGPVGGHMSQTDPTCFENFAYANPDVIAIITFVWINGWQNVPTNLGIKSIPALKATYTALGKRLTGRA